MATVSASLDLFSQFSRTMERSQNNMQSTVRVAERLQRTLQARFQFNIDTSATVNHLERILLLVRSIRSVSMIRIGFAINKSDIIRQLARIQIVVPVRVVFAAAAILVQAQQIRQNILQVLGNGILQFFLKLPSTLMSAFKGVKTQARRLFDSVKRIWAPKNAIADKPQDAGEKAASDNPKKGKGFNLLGSVKGLAGKAFDKLAMPSMKAAMEEESLRDLLIARTGDEQLGSAMFDKFKKDGLKSGVSVADNIKGVLSFMPVAEDTKQLSDMTHMAQRLAALDPEGKGMGGAVSSVKDMMKGDFKSLKEKFNVSETSIQSAGLESLAKKGDNKGLIESIGKLLEQNNLGEQAFDRVLNSPLKQVEKLKNNLTGSLAEAGRGAIAAILPLFQKLNQAFDEGKFKPFFDALQTGLRAAAVLIVPLAEGALWFVGMIQNNWPLISQIFAGIASMIGVMLIPQLWAMIPPLLAMIPPILTQAGLWLTATWPILLVAALIGFLVYVLLQCGVTFAEIIGFITGSFMTLVGIVWNTLALIVNYFLSLVEFIANMFFDPVYAINKLFYDLVVTFGGYMYSMLRSAEDFAGGFMTSILDGINEALKGFNWLSDAIKKMTGVDLGQAGLFNSSNIHALSDELKNTMDLLQKPTTNKFVVSIPRMGYKDLKNEFDYGYKIGHEFTNSLSIKSPSDEEPEYSNKLSNINRVNEIGSIKDTVDVSSEDLKVMRDLAEMENIQNFVTLTPTVQVTTGDIRHEMDVNDMIFRIEQVMQQEISNSAQGVYT
ncbi:hypothetical protein PAESOLCIP111_01968 [Paenibacillus solanacearum]|uniref:Tail length tape measure protein n=1 Tax=Paenibacillus solanacearum TaxID=2048548 RepID=A0A916JZQ3_9BACL|nr:hypothetical protein [Paenibacillus solanacearum]CAG7616991.1 hypothetical protein PAESOLCIP111_01968 [Paenibacillus solanacearum]